LGGTLPEPAGIGRDSQLDEKSQVQAVAQSRPTFLMMPGTRRPQPGQSMEPESQTLIWTKTQNKSWKLSGGL
jgi:hypothetical protein